MVSIEDEISAIINVCGEKMCILAACVSNEHEDDDERFRFWVKGVSKYSSPSFLGIINMLCVSGGKLIESGIKNAIELSADDCRHPKECLGFQETKHILKEIKPMIKELKDSFGDEIWIISYEYMFLDNDVPPDKQGKYPPGIPVRKVEWSEGAGSEDFPIIQFLYLFLSEGGKIGIDTLETQLLLTEEQVELIKGLI